tara:strand:+ start:440 stop:739 length:300 start_codon:yes stop_codon:yes gene_type:complete
MAVGKPPKPNFWLLGWSPRGEALSISVSPGRLLRVSDFEISSSTPLGSHGIPPPRLSFSLPLGVSSFFKRFNRLWKPERMSFASVSRLQPSHIKEPLLN